MDKIDEKKQRATLTVAVITAFITTFTGSALNLSIPDIGAEFNAGAALVGWIVTAYMLASAAFSVPFGRIADITSRRKILTIGIFIFAVCSLAAVFAWDIKVILILRAVQGFGAAMIFSTNIAMLISAFPEEMKGKVIGFSTASTYIGLSAGPVVGGVVNHYLGWRWIFALTFAVSITVFLIAVMKIPKDTAEKTDADRDVLGNILYIGSLICVLYGLSAFSISTAAKFMIPIGIFLSAWFVKHELRTSNPIIEFRLFMGNLSYTFSNIAALFNYGATFSIGYFLSIYLQVNMGYSSQIAGLILVTQPVVMAVLSPITGRISDRVSPFKLASFGMSLCAASLLFFSFFKENSPLWLIIGVLVVAGTGVAFFASPNTNAVMTCVQKSDYGVASSILATMRTIGHTSSMAVIGAVVGMYMGSTALADAEPEILMKTIHTAFMVFTAVCVVGTGISLKRK